MAKGPASEIRGKVFQSWVLALASGLLAAAACAALELSPERVIYL